MKSAKWITLCLVFGTSLFGATAMLSALEQREDATPQQPEARPEGTKPPQAHPAERKQEAKPAEQGEDKNGRPEEKPVKPDHDKHPMQSDRKDKERTAEQRQGSADHRGAKIPEEKFHANFGRQHTFVVRRLTVVEGQPRFQYGGYYFTFVDAWPAGWDYSDECYIDEVGGEYFLFDLAHPGVRIAVVVVM